MGQFLGQVEPIVSEDVDTSYRDSDNIPEEAPSLRSLYSLTTPSFHTLYSYNLYVLYYNNLI